MNKTLTEIASADFKESLESILHLNGCQQRTAGFNEKDLDMNDMERLEVLTLEEVYDKAMKFARRNATFELERVQKVCENEDGEFAFILANAIEDRIHFIRSENEQN